MQTATCYYGYIITQALPSHWKHIKMRGKKWSSIKFDDTSLILSTSTAVDVETGIKRDSKHEGEGVCLLKNKQTTTKRNPIK